MGLQLLLEGKIPLSVQSEYEHEDGTFNER